MRSTVEPNRRRPSGEVSGRHETAPSQGQPHTEAGGTSERHQRTNRDFHMTICLFETGLQVDVQAERGEIKCEEWGRDRRCDGVTICKIICVTMAWCGPKQLWNDLSPDWDVFGSHARNSTLRVTTFPLQAYKMQYENEVIE